MAGKAEKIKVLSTIMASMVILLILKVTFFPIQTVLSL